jgi:hypothetical protein
MANNPANLRTVTVAGGNLFQLAAQYLGDAQQWNRIASLNGLWDPMIVGVVTLLIPPVIPNLLEINPNMGGGVLGSPN